MNYLFAILIACLGFTACNTSTENQVKETTETTPKVVTQKDIEQQSIENYLSNKALTAKQTKSGL